LHHSHLVKAAHLTLFHIIGYRHALSAGGHFLGRDILGQFFLANKGKNRSQIRAAGVSFFQEFVHMTRPVTANPFNLQGTLTDRTVFLCRQQNWYWAMTVFIRTSSLLHGVMVPVLEHPDSAPRYLNFLRTDNEFCEGSFCKIQRDGNWLMDKQILPMSWPKDDPSFHLV
jgi:hypothetical protein